MEFKLSELPNQAAVHIAANIAHIEALQFGYEIANGGGFSKTKVIGVITDGLPKLLRAEQIEGTKFRNRTGQCKGLLCA